MCKIKATIKFCVKNSTLEHIERPSPIVEGVLVGLEGLWLGVGVGVVIEVGGVAGVSEWSV